MTTEWKVSKVCSNNGMSCSSSSCAVASSRCSERNLETSAACSTSCAWSEDEGPASCCNNNKNHQQRKSWKAPFCTGMSHFLRPPRHHHTEDCAEVSDEGLSDDFFAPLFCRACRSFSASPNTVSNSCAFCCKSLHPLCVCLLVV